MRVGLPRGLRAWDASRQVLIGLAAAGIAFLLTLHLNAERPALFYIAGVMAATAVASLGGFAAATLGAGLFAFAGRGDDLLDTLLFVVVAFAVPLLAARVRREHGRLRASEHRYRVLAEELPVGLYLDLPDTSATNVYSNPEIERMLGYPAERWVGDPTFFGSLLHPDDRDRVLEGVSAGIELDNHFDDVYRLLHADGDYRWIADRGRLVHDEHGKPLHVQGVLIDITAEKEAEHRYESLVTRLPLVTYVEDAHTLGRTLYISPQVVELLGYPVERWLNEQDFFFAVLDPAMRPDVTADRAADDPETTRELRLIAADGSERWVDSRRTVVRDDTGAPLYTLGFWVDITARHQLEQQLRHHERLEGIGELAAGLAHNFNNMLVAILGYAELAMKRDTLGAVHRDLEGIREAGQRSAQLVQHLLAFSRRQAMAPRPTDIRVVVEELIGLIRQLLGPAIEIRFDPPAVPTIASIDRAQLEQVLINLAVNARDAMPGGGTLTIELREQPTSTGPLVLLAVSDTGSGMSPHVAEHVFDPFFTTKGAGTGLGLASAYGTILQFGGDLRIARTAPDEGTTFEITLPRADAA